MEAPKRYHHALVTMHWMIALLVFINLYLGIVIFENKGGNPGASPGGFQVMNPLVGVHMAVGITIIVLLIARVILRVKTNRPVEATAGNKKIRLTFFKCVCNCFIKSHGAKIQKFSPTGYIQFMETQGTYSHANTSGILLVLVRV